MSNGIPETPVALRSLRTRRFRPGTTSLGSTQIPGALKAFRPSSASPNPACPSGSVSLERNDVMKANSRRCLICQRMAEIQLSDLERQRATYALHDAEAIADALIWVKEGIASLGAILPKLGFKH